MKPRKQRLHSAELRRLDHIAGSLDRIAAALEKNPCAVANGDNDIVIDNMVVKAGDKSQFALRGLYNASGINVKNSQGVMLNSSEGSIESRGNNQPGQGNVYAEQSPAAGSKIGSSQVSTSGDGGASSTGGASATISKHSDIDRIDVGQGVGVQEDGQSYVNNHKINNGNNAGDNYGDMPSQRGNDSSLFEAKGVSSAFNTNANDVVKDLTEALHRSTVQRLDQYKET